MNFNVTERSCARYLIALQNPRDNFSPRAQTTYFNRVLKEKIKPKSDIKMTVQLDY